MSDLNPSPVTTGQSPHFGVIFDVDGVLLDSNPAHLESWRMMASKDGFDFSEDLFQRTFGQTTRSILANHWNRRLTPEEIDRMDREKEDLYREIAAKRLPAMPGAADFVKKLYDAGVPMSVGSSGPGYNVHFVMEKLGIVPYLKGIVSGTDVVHGKPAPDIFLLCAEKMGIAPGRCVVLDDSKSGITAARAAGMKIVGFFSQGHKVEEYEGVDLLVHSFAELTLNSFSSLFSASET